VKRSIPNYGKRICSWKEWENKWKKVLESIDNNIANQLLPMFHGKPCSFLEKKELHPNKENCLTSANTLSRF
jgi:hypothetical protein